MDSILVIVVIYRMSVESTPAWSSLLTNHSSKEGRLEVLIYDNSPASQDVTEQQYLNIHYVHDPRNPGVSTAYNEGARLARNLNKKWLLLLDQDTKWDPHTLSAYIETTVSHADMKVFAPSVEDDKGLLSPFRFRWGSGTRLTEWERETIDLSLYSVVNSGLLISVNAFLEVGGYDESIPLDFSDIDFCSRLAQRGIIAQHVPCMLRTTHSSSLSQSTEVGTQRFRLYCQGAARLAKSTGDTMILIRQHLRSVQLSLRHRDTQFISISLSA